MLKTANVSIVIARIAYDEKDGKGYDGSNPGVEQESVVPRESTDYKRQERR